MRKPWIHKSLILALIISVVAGNISAFASDDLTVGSSTTIGESQAITSSSNKRISDLLTKSKVWDGQNISEKGIYAVTSDMVLTTDVSICKDATLLIPETSSLSINSGKLDNQGEIIGMPVIYGGNMINSGKIDTVAVLDGSLTNNLRIDNLMLGGGSVTNNEVGLIQTVVSSSGELRNLGNIKLIDNKDKGIINNADGGIISNIKISDGNLFNFVNSIIETLSIEGGAIINQGTIDSTTQNAGEFINSSILNNVIISQGKFSNLHTIEDITVSNGDVENNGYITQISTSGGEFTNLLKGKISKSKVNGGIFANEGTVDNAKISGGVFENRLDGKLQQAELSLGNFYNIGSATLINIAGGELKNTGAVTQLQITGGKATNAESLIKNVEVTAGQFINTGLVESAQVSRDGIINNDTEQSIIKHVIIKNTGNFTNQGEAQKITNNMGDLLYKISIQENNLGKVNAEADRRSVGNRYVVAGKKIKLTATPKSGNQFIGWSFSEDVETSFKDASKVETTIIMPAQDITIIPKYQTIGVSTVGESSSTTLTDEEIPEQLPGELAI